MSRVIIFLINMVVTVPLFAAGNNQYLSFFSSSAIQKSNTAKDQQKLSSEEKEVILWTNLARTEPQNFYKMLIVYFQKNPEFQLKNPYVQSLLKDLDNSSPVQELTTAVLLNNNASSHAGYSQLTKRMGHEGFDNRARIAFNEHYTGYGENCVYGVRDALHAVVALLVDEGVPDLGHRKIMLNDKFNQIGVSMIPFYDAQRKVMIQQFGTTSTPLFYPQKEPEKTVTAPVIEEVKPAPVASTLKQMFINGKYVLVDTAKYYTPAEYQQYVKKAQQIKSSAK